MFLTNDPGPWQYYVKRADNVGLPIEVVTRKYLTESVRYQQQMDQWSMQAQNYSNASMGGPGAVVNDTPSLSSNCIEFVNNTSDGTQCRFWVETSAPTNYTITWGDGETTTGQTTDDVEGGVGIGNGDNKLEVYYSYANSNTEYTARICFDNISLVNYLEFNGDD